MDFMCDDDSICYFRGFMDEWDGYGYGYMIDGLNESYLCIHAL